MSRKQEYLDYIKEHPGCSCTNVANHFGVTRQAVSLLLHNTPAWEEAKELRRQINYNLTHVFMTCQQCGKYFSKLKAHITKSNQYFCSRGCHNKSRALNMTPKEYRAYRTKRARITRLKRLEDPEYKKRYYEIVKKNNDKAYAKLKKDPIKFARQMKKNHERFKLKYKTDETFRKKVREYYKKRDSTPEHKAKRKAYYLKNKKRFHAAAKAYYYKNREKMIAKAHERYLKKKAFDNA